MNDICEIYEKTEIGKLGIKYGGESLVIRAFTGAGKTLFILCDVMKWALDNGYTLIYTTSLRTAVREVHKKAIALYGQDKVGYVMGLDAFASPEELVAREREWRKPIVISTYEQAVRHVMRGGKRDVVVIDEYHNVLTEFRKYKLLFLMAVARMYNIPVIIMSATMPDKDKIAEYLNAKIIDKGSNWDNKDVKTVIVPKYKPKELIKALRGIVIPRMRIGERGIVFINSKRLCYELGSAVGIPCVTGDMSEDVKEEILERLRNNEVTWIISTSTLAESINEPFDDAVIIVNPLTPPFEITQMAGRAGRFGNKAVIYIITTQSMHKCVDSALREKYGSITLTKNEYPDLVAAYAELITNIDDMRKVIAETYGINDDPDEVIKVAKYSNAVNVRGNLVTLTNIGKWMNMYLAKYEEYEVARDCMSINRNPYAAWFCYTLSITGRGFPRLSEENRAKYRDALTKLLGYNPFSIQIAVPPRSVYRGTCSSMNLDVLDIVTTYDISLNVGDWLTYIYTGNGKHYAVYYELPYTQRKLMSLGLQFDDAKFAPWISKSSE